MAHRLEIPVILAPGTELEREFQPGDWLVVGESPIFIKDSIFRGQFRPDDDSARRVWETDFALVVDEYRPMLAMQDVCLHRRYEFVMQQMATILPSQGYRGVITGFPTPGSVRVTSDNGNSVVLVWKDIRYVVPVYPETEPCLLRSRGSTDPARARRPDA